jgi:hypothetical protein
MPDVLETPGLVTVTSRELAHRLTELRRMVAEGSWVRIIDGARPDAEPLWLTSEPPAWYGQAIPDDMPQVREFVRSRKATRGPRRSVEVAEAQRLMQINLDGSHHD